MTSPRTPHPLALPTTAHLCFLPVNTGLRGHNVCLQWVPLSSLAAHLQVHARSHQLPRRKVVAYIDAAHPGVVWKWANHFCEPFLLSELPASPEETGAFWVPSLELYGVRGAFPARSSRSQQWSLSQSRAKGRRT